MLAALPAPVLAQQPVSVLIVGLYHMSNPGRDLHDVHADDVLAPKRQAELAAIDGALARFKPTQVDVEWSADDAAKYYAAFQKGSYASSHNEVVQLGFRLARQTAASVYGIDVDGDFPYEAVEAFAKAHGLAQLLADADADVVKQVQMQQHLLDTGSISDVLRWVNDPSRIAANNAFYGQMSKIGQGAQQPGADLLTAWYKRNAYICANIVQLAKPGDRVVVFYGSGHAFLLRACISQTPGFVLVEPNDYLPK
jgi:hypothetical protein